MREHLRDVSRHAMAVVDDIGPLSNPFRDALAPALEKEIREVGAVTRRDTFHEKVEMQCAAPLELHMHEPFDRPALPRCTPQLPQMITTLAPRQMLTRGQREPERRRASKSVECEHLDRLDDVERLAVAAQVRRPTPPRSQLARGVIPQRHPLRPAGTTGAGVTNSLMQVKGRDLPSDRREG
jgi:hypothetical protein